MYLNYEYNECTITTSGVNWCATSLNADKTYATYDYCNMDNCESDTSCKTADYEVCVFPFIHKGDEYDQCTVKDNGKHWCATSVTDDKIWSTWGYCNMEENCVSDGINFFLFVLLIGNNEFLQNIFFNVFS
jgi:hypothetical protein